MIPESMWHLLFVACMAAFVLATVAYLVFKCVTRRLKRLQILPVAMIPNSTARPSERQDDNQPENGAEAGQNGNNRVFYILVVPGSDQNNNGNGGTTQQAVTASDGSIYTHHSGWHYRKTRPPSYDAVMRQDAALGVGSQASSRRQSSDVGSLGAQNNNATTPGRAGTPVDDEQLAHVNGAFNADDCVGAPSSEDPNVIPPPSYDTAVRHASRRKSSIMPEQLPHVV